MICTGRSDYPNQVNNVLCFPYIFRGALDVGASEINEAMKKAAVKAIAALARETPSEVVARAYGGSGAVRPRFADPEPVRSAPDHAHRSRGGARGDGERRRAATDRRFRRLRRSAGALRLPLRFHDEAAVRQGARRAQAGDLQRRRGRAGAARHAGRARGGHRRADPDRTARGHRRAHQALRPQHDAGRISGSSIPSAIHAFAIMSRRISRSPGARASRPTSRARWWARRR